MIRIASETELMGCFRDLDRGEVELPDGLRFPLGLKDYLSWLEPSGSRAYLIYRDPESGKALGIVFRRDQSHGSAPALMCEWCHSVRGGDGVRMLSATASDRRRVGLYVCSDLSCKQKIEAAPGVDDVPESASAAERVRRVVSRMAEFSRRNLF